MSYTLTFEVQFLSDFHIGSGYGAGSEIKSALHRDPDGVPVIRGSILTGLLRDSLRQLLMLKSCEAWLPDHLKDTGGGFSYCGQFTSAGKTLCCPLCALFGSPRHPKRWRISSARPVKLAAPQIPGSWHVGQSGTQIVTRLRVNPRTRRAEENKLFAIEEGNQDIRFRFQAECLAEDNAAHDEAAWLLAATLYTRAIGASKHRGRGECRITLVDGSLGQEALLAHFEQLLIHGSSQGEDKKQEQVSITLPVSTAASAPYTVRVILRNDEPLLMARRAEAGNQFESLSVISGSVLRGALAWRVAQHLGDKLEGGQTEYDAFRTLFFSYRVRFSTLLPLRVDKLARTGIATLQAPKDLVTCELQPGYEYDDSSKSDVNGHGHGVISAFDAEELQKQCPHCRGKLEPVRDFLSLDSQNPALISPPQKQSEMHIRLDPHTQRVSRNDLYGYLALDPGQYWLGEITCATKELWELLKELASLQSEGANHLHLGKASRRGYGRVSFYWEEAKKSAWLAEPLQMRLEDKVPFSITITYLTDTIVKDMWGRYVRDFAPDWLQAALQLPEAATIKVQQQFVTTRSIDSFHAKAGLPRSRDIALEAGSTAKLSIAGVDYDTLLKALTTIEEDGVGLRRNEGFGRVAFNHPVHRSPKDWPSAEDIEIPKALRLGSQASSDPQISADYFKQAWGQALDEKTIEWWGKHFAASEKHRERFGAVARFLHTTNLTDAQAIMQEIRGWGVASKLLPSPVYAEIKAGRSGENFFQKKNTNGETTDTVELVALRELLMRLTQQIHGRSDVQSARLWKVGLEMLADRISAVARADDTTATPVTSEVAQ